MLRSYYSVKCAHNVLGHAPSLLPHPDTSPLENCYAFRVKLLFTPFWSCCCWVLTIQLQQLRLRTRRYCSTSLLSLPHHNETAKAHLAFLHGLVTRILVRRPLDLLDLFLQHTHSLLCKNISESRFNHMKKLTNAVLMAYLKVVATSEWVWSMSTHWCTYRTWAYQKGNRKSNISALCSDIATKTKATAHSINSFKLLFASSFLQS